MHTVSLRMAWSVTVGAFNSSSSKYCHDRNRAIIPDHVPSKLMTVVAEHKHVSSCSLGVLHSVRRIHSGTLYLRAKLSQSVASHVVSLSRAIPKACNGSSCLSSAPLPVRARTGITYNSLFDIASI